MNIRFYNGSILTMNGGTAICNGELWVKDNLISYIGEGKNNDIVFDREINLQRNILMPTFKNAHAHSAMTFLRSYADDVPLQDWLFNKVFPMEAKLTEEHVYHFSRLAYLEYLTSGIGACFDMYFHPESIAKASDEFGMRTVMCGSVSGEKENSEKLKTLFDKYKNYSELVSYRLGFHAEYTAETELMKNIAKLSEQLEAPVFSHSSETKKEVDDCFAKYGKTPTELFESLGLMNYGGGYFHCVHVTDGDIQILKKNNIFVVTNPGSNAKLASGIAPITKMCDMEINLAIGTDGAASNNCLDMFKEMFLTTSLQKLNDNNAAAMNANNVLQMATVGGAHCMGLDDCDTLEVGKKADMIVIDLHQPNMQPINNITKNIVYSGSKQNVKMTMINGKILYENGDFVGVDSEEIYYNANKLLQSM